MNMSIKIIIFFFGLFYFKSFAQVNLNIDSAVISTVKWEKSEVSSFKVFWRICNIHGKTIKRFSCPWQIASGLVNDDTLSEYDFRDSILMKMKLERKGIGNSLFYLINGEEKEKSISEGYLQSPGINNNFFSIDSGRCKSGAIEVFFNKINNKNKYNLQMVYNSIFETTEKNANIWRGRLESNKYEIENKTDNLSGLLKNNLQPSPPKK